MGKKQRRNDEAAPLFYVEVSARIDGQLMCEGKTQTKARVHRHAASRLRLFTLERSWIGDANARPMVAASNLHLDCLLPRTGFQGVT